ncbi:MAG: D-alanine--D-alanine ligase [Vulcanimicrobiota bacterium]
MKIGVLMGGRSPEREISLKTGKNILESLKGAGFDAVGIDADEKVVEKMNQEEIGLAFIALHGPLGEDGTIQGLLEFLDIPYTGTGVLGSALAMNKVATKQILEYHHIPTPKYYSFDCKLLDTPEGLSQLEKMAAGAEVELPVIVKPSVGGSTIGTNIIKNREDLIDAYRQASLYCTEILVEEFITGMEITVGVLGDEAPFAVPVIEIIAEGGFYNYTTKYQPGMSTHIIPARIPDDLYGRAQEYAVEVFRKVHCFGMGRVDFMVELEKKKMWCLEINTIPGMTETSLLPEAAAKCGIDFETLLKDQIKYALNRHKKMKEVSLV